MRLFFFATAAVPFLTACSGAPPPSAQAPVTVFAASSTTQALEDVAQAFEKEAGVPVRTSFAGSSVLARQIEAGAEADLFLGANEEWADYVAQRVHVVERRDLLANRLVVVVPAQSGANVGKAEDLLGPAIQRIAVADPESVPAGMYAREALQKLGLWNRLKAKTIPAADVRQALLYVERGEADAGIVYATDAQFSRSVRIAFELPPDLTTPIRYPLLLLKESPAARRFYDYLASSQAAETFRHYGFATPETVRILR